MSSLTIKQIDWQFDDVEFYFNPANREFSAFMNAISFMAVGLERYFCKAMKDAEPLITDPAVLEECRMFNRQEMVHSKAHYRHCKALIARYPELQEALDGAIRMYDELYERESLKYHLSYMGGLESAFTPLFGTIIDHRDVLFGGDSRVSSLFLWHFCEEIEHRSSAITVYNHVIGEHIYRMRNVKPMTAHGGEVTLMLQDVFRRAVPDFDTEDFFLTWSQALPKWTRRKMGWKILASQLPFYPHDSQRLPAYFAEWNRRYEAGEDMRFAYGGPRLAAAA
jgi:predicted metal-dependent hydrolase